VLRLKPDFLARFAFTGVTMVPPIHPAVGMSFR
jgi:hypothetical protein